MLFFGVVVRGGLSFCPVGRTNYIDLFLCYRLCFDAGDVGVMNMPFLRLVFLCWKVRQTHEAIFLLYCDAGIIARRKY